jgi:hypothetical protein
MNVKVLAVSEVENALLLPRPFVELAKLLKFDAAGAGKKLEELRRRRYPGATEVSSDESSEGGLAHSVGAVEPDDGVVGDAIGRLEDGGRARS